MIKEVVRVQGSSPSAPYSPGVKAGGFVFTSGQVGVNPVTQGITKGDVAAQTKQALENVKDVLEAAGTSLDKVIKATVFLTNMEDFAAMNAVYRTYFPENPPARSTVGAALVSKDMLVEIEVVALA